MTADLGKPDQSPYEPAGRGRGDTAYADAPVPRIGPPRDPGAPPASGVGPDMPDGPATATTAAETGAAAARARGPEVEQPRGTGGGTGTTEAASRAPATAAVPESSGLRRLGHPKVLDGVRGIAVVLVVLFHTKVLHGNGFIGVDVFFVLSGFLITTLLCEEHARTGRIDLRGFYARRARRLLPALGLLVVGAIIASTVTSDLGGHLPVPVMGLVALGFVANWVTVITGQGTLGALSPTWSLAEEEQFYLLWPALLALLLRLRPTRVVAILAGAIVALVVIADQMTRLVPHWSLFFNPVDRAAELLLGALVSIAWRHRLMRHVAVITRHWLFGWLVVAAGAWTVWQTVLFQVPTYRLAALLGALLLIHTLDRPGALLGRLLSIPPLRHVGRISYGLYLYHLPITWTLRDELPGAAFWLRAVLSIGLAYLLAVLSYRFVESRVLRRRTTAATT